MRAVPGRCSTAQRSRAYCITRSVDGHHLEKEYRFQDFREALDFTNKIGEMAEEQDHHPDILLTWGRVKVTIWTHKIDGLTESDFIFSAKADVL